MGENLIHYNLFIEIAFHKASADVVASGAQLSLWKKFVSGSQTD